MTTQPAAAAAVAAACSHTGLTTYRSEVPMVIDEENANSSDSTLRTPELGPEVCISFFTLISHYLKNHGALLL